MSGEYGSGSPGYSQSMVDAIAGSHYVAMEQLGNFPMTENYPQFRPYLVSVLDEIAAKTAK